MTVERLNPGFLVLCGNNKVGWPHREWVEELVCLQQHELLCTGQNQVEPDKKHQAVTGVESKI